ncbi:Inositol monophosphatase [Planctomycetales bacterium 10988]|nr:Inositol monophosphatase [Planctomycetales bacterium 10988]
MSERLESACQAALAGGEILLRWAGKIAAKEKAPSDLVTQADVESQEVIERLLLSSYPEYEFLGEEGNPDEGPSSGKPRWIVDPLDGTMNYVHGLANYSVSIGLEEEGEMVLGVVYDPLTEELFTAIKGKGAFLNGKKIQTSEVSKLNQGLIAASFGNQITREAPEVEHFLRVLEKAQGVRRMGSAALNLCYVASGRLDGYWATTTHLWDIAAGMVILTEAGGQWSGFDGEPFDPLVPHFIAASTEPLHQALTNCLHDRK